MPGDIGGAEDEDTGGVVSYAVHLNEHLGLYPSACFALAFAPCAAQCINLVDKDDRGLVLARHCEQLFDEPVGDQLAATQNRTEPGGAYRSLSPIHLLTRSLELTEKNVPFASVATAFAK